MCTFNSVQCNMASLNENDNANVPEDAPRPVNKPMKIHWDVIQCGSEEHSAHAPTDKPAENSTTYARYPIGFFFDQNNKVVQWDAKMKAKYPELTQQIIYEARSNRFYFLHSSEIYESDFLWENMEKLVLKEVEAELENKHQLLLASKATTS